MSCSELLVLVLVNWVEFLNDLHVGTCTVVVATSGSGSGSVVVVVVVVGT